MAKDLKITLVSAGLSSSGIIAMLNQGIISLIDLVWIIQQPHFSWISFGK